MPTFQYLGRDKQGSPVEGSVEADSYVLATITLRRQGLAIETLAEQAPLGQAGAVLPPIPLLRPGVWESLNPLSAGRLAGFWSQFAQLIHAGLTPHQAMTALPGRVTGRLRNAVLAMTPGLAAGRPLAEEAAQHPGVFPPYVVGMLRAAQSSGDVEAVAGDLAGQYEQDYQAWLALLPLKAYLTFVLFMCLIVAPLPRIVIGADNWILGLKNLGVFELTRVLPCAAGGVVALFLLRALLNLPWFRPVKDAVLYHLPLVNQPMIVTGRWRFMRCLQVLTRAGVPLPEAVETSTQALGNVAMARPFRQAVEQMRSTGAGIGALAQLKLMPAEAHDVLLTAEQAGTYDQALEGLAARAAQERQNLLQASGKFMFVAMYLVVGVIVAITLYFALMGYFDALFLKGDALLHEN